MRGRNGSPLAKARLRLAFAFLLASAAPARTSTTGALAVVRETLSAASAVVNGPGTRDEKLDSLRHVAREMLDTRAMGSQAIGDELAGVAPELREEYFELFDHVIVRAYLSKLLLFRDPRFAYLEPRPVARGVVVRTRIVTSGDDYAVDYLMVEREGRWRASDVIVEGMSLSGNYRDQFESLLRGRSFEELLELMRRKTRRLREPS